MATVAEFIGKTHPLLLHFPLALLVVAALAEGVRVFRDSPFLSRTTTWLLAVGAITAVLSAGSGWLLAAHEHIRSDQRDTLAWHRWLGLATAATAMLAWLVAARADVFPSRPMRRSLALITALLVIATGFFGGEMVWGRDWFQVDEVHTHE